MSGGQTARAIYVEVDDVGKRVKTSKKKVTWKLCFDGDPQDHVVMLKHSVMSGKKTLFVNGRQMYKTQNVFSAELDHSFSLPGHVLRVRAANRPEALPASRRAAATP